jgi:hypothetical protein
MQKYLSIATVNDGVLQIPVQGGIIAQYMAGTHIHIFTSILGSSAKLKIEGTGVTQALVDNVNAALKTAAETNWRKSVVAVSIPNGTVINDWSII